MTTNIETHDDDYGTKTVIPLPHVEVIGPGVWMSLDGAPKDKPVLLFCPWTDSPDGTGAHPDAKQAHGRVVGWWDEEAKHWVAGILNGPVHKVYPSRWAELLDEPKK